MTIFGLSITKKSNTVTLGDLTVLHDELMNEIDAIKSDIEPVKAFMEEHAQNIIESEQEYNRVQKAFADGINHITNYSYETARKKGDK
jgi:hypothetical protein